MTLQKASVSTGNGSIQTFLKDGNHINTEPIQEYVLLESASIPISTSRVFRLRDRLLTIQPLILWYNPSVSGQNFTFAIRQDSTILYSLPFNSGQPYVNLPTMFLKPLHDIVITTPMGLSLTSVYIVAKEVAYSEIIMGI